MTDRDSATGRVSQGVTGPANADSASAGGSAAGAQVERTTLGNTTGSAGGGTLDMGEGAAGGLGLHGDREARLRAASDSLTGPSGSADTTDAARGVPTGPTAASQRGPRASGADRREAGAGLRGSGASVGDRLGDRQDEEAASPDAQDGSTTAAIGGSAIDRATTGQGGDYGGSVTGPG